MLFNYTCTSTAPSAQLLPYAAMCAGVTAFSTGGDLPRVTGTDTAHGNCQWRLLQRKSSSFLRVLCYCMCTRDATPLLYGRTRMHLLVERHIPWPHAAMRMFPHGSDHRSWSVASGCDRQVPVFALSTTVRDCIPVTPLLLFFRV